MSRVWIDFIHSQDILNSEVMFGDQLFRAKILADGLTTQSGIKASVDGVGRTYVLNLKPGEIIEAFISKEHIRAFTISGEIQIGDATFPEWLFLEGGIGSKFPKILAITDVELVVLSGGIGRQAEFFLSPINKLVSEILPFPPKIAVSKLGDNGILIGTLQIATEEAREKVFQSAMVPAALDQAK